MSRLPDYAERERRAFLLSANERRLETFCVPAIVFAVGAFALLEGALRLLGVIQ